jgi:H+-transporting ATPase
MGEFGAMTKLTSGLLLAAGTWIIRGALFLSPDGQSGGLIQNFGSVQEVLFLEVALTESWIICEWSP